MMIPKLAVLELLIRSSNKNIEAEAVKGISMVDFPSSSASNKGEPGMLTWRMRTRQIKHFVFTAAVVTDIYSTVAIQGNVAQPRSHARAEWRDPVTWN